MSALDEVAKIWPHCYTCQVMADFADVSEEQAQELLEQRGRLQESHPPILALVDFFHYKCSECLGAESIKKSQQQARAKVKKLKDRLVRDHLLTLAAISTGFELSNKEIEGANKELWAWAKAWEPRHGGAWFYGKEGVGKSYLARCMVMRHVHQGRSAGEVSAITLVQRAGSWDWHKEHNALSQLNLLLIEDMDKAQWTMKGLEALWALMDARFNSGARTLVTSNGDPEFMKHSWNIMAQSNISFIPTLMARFLPMTRYELGGNSLRRQFYAQPIPDVQAEIGGQST